MTKVVVEDGIVTIGANAFADLVNAGELTLPGSVTALGENALPEQLRGSEADFAGTLVTFGTEAVTIPAVPEQEGKTGTWNAYTLKSGETAAVEAAYENVYHAVFVADGQTVAAVEFTEGAVSVEEPAVPEKTGYTGTWEPYTLGAEDLEIHAVYMPVTYHAAFVAGGKTVGTVEFTVETASLTEPAVPARIGYTGAWEAYTLGAGDVTVNAVYTPVTYHATFTAGALHRGDQVYPGSAGARQDRLHRQMGELQADHRRRDGQGRLHARHPLRDLHGGRQDRREGVLHRGDQVHPGPAGTRQERLQRQVGVLHSGCEEHHGQGRLYLCLLPRHRHGLAAERPHRPLDGGGVLRRPRPRLGRHHHGGAVRRLYDLGPAG